MGKKPLGRPMVVREDDDDAYYEVPLYGGVPELLVDGLRDGAYGASFQFALRVEDYVAHPGRSAHNPDGIAERTVRDATVFEFGPVTFPAYEGATAGLRWWAQEGGETRAAWRHPDDMRRIVRGTGMVTPTKAMTVAVGGGAETYRPSITRIAVDHDLVSERPGDFTPADATDGATRERLRELGGSTRTTTRPGVLPTGRVGSTAFRLPRDEEPFRLPTGKVLP